MSRLLSWFTTRNGRRATRFFVGTAAATVFGSYLAFNGPWLNNFKKMVQCYRLSEPRELPQKVNVLIEEVLQDSTLKEEEKKKVKFFYAIGHELFSAGSIKFPWGAIVGIPFTYEDINDINFGNLKLQGQEYLDWVIDGQDLIKAITISNSAKKFGLMREIYSCDSSNILENASLLALCILIPARFALLFNNKTKALERFSFQKRSVLYAMFYCFGILLYRLVKDPTKHILDKKVDELAAETGPEYLNGGIEYYKKILMKNKALKELPNSMFKKSFDDQGNENYVLFAPKMPVSKRLELLQDLKKERTSKAS